jgi:hypothetical protein
MTKQFDNTNRWKLGRNHKPKDERSPEFKGSINIDGVEYWLNGWVREGNGEKFFAGTVAKKEEQKQSRPLDDDMPF